MTFYLTKALLFNLDLNIVDSEYKSLSQCKNEDKKCTSEAGIFSVTYAEDRLKRLLVVIKVENITDQGKKKNY